MQADEFLAFAGKIALLNYGPAGYRSAVSRAYYAAFILAREFLASLSYNCPHGANPHQWVQHHFENCKLAQAKELGKKLANLHSSRKECDYDVANASVETLANAQACVARAEAIRNGLVALTDASTISQVRLEMQAYRQSVRLA